MNHLEFWLLALCAMVCGGTTWARGGVEPEFVFEVNAADFIAEKDPVAKQGSMPKAGTRVELNHTGELNPLNSWSVTYGLPAEADGSYAIWVVGGGSGHFGKSVYTWSLDGSEFRLASNNALVTPATNTQAFNDRLIELVQAVELRKGEHRLTIRIDKGDEKQNYSFSLAKVLLAKAWQPKPVALPDGIALRSGDRVCFIGDSITTGGHYIRDVAAAFTKVFPQAEIRFFNCDNPGDTTNGAVARLDRDVLAMKPSWVVIALGINDVRDMSLWQYLWNMNDMVKRIKASGAGVMLLTPTVYDEDPAKQWKDDSPYIVKMLNNEAVKYHNRVLIAMSAEIKALAKANGALVADVYTPFKTLIAQRAQGKNPLDLLPDRLHPSPEGHVVMAIAILKAFGMTNAEIEQSGLAIPAPIREVFGLAAAGR